jgi:selenocysteine-specific elongation factor
VAESGIEGLPIEDLPIRLGLSPAAIASLVIQAGTVLQLGSRIYLKQILTELSEAIVKAVVAYHSSHPLAPGMPLASARLNGANSHLSDAMISRLLAQSMVESSDGLLRAPGWRPRVTGSDEGHLSWLRARLKEAGREPPSVAELRIGINGNDPIPVLRILEREGIVVQVEPERFYDAGVVAGMMQQLRDGMRDGATYAPAQLRELLGVSRKYLMPFLEYCDRRHVTERHENGRVLARQEAR